MSILERQTRACSFPPLGCPIIRASFRTRNTASPSPTTRVSFPPYLTQQGTCITLSSLPPFQGKVSNSHYYITLPDDPRLLPEEMSSPSIRTEKRKSLFRRSTSNPGEEVCIDAYTYRYIYTYMCVYIYIYIYNVYIYICVCVCVCVYIYIYIYI